MKKKRKSNFKFDGGIKGLEISLVILIFLAIILIIIALENTGEGILKKIFLFPNSFLDFNAIFAGVILFVAVPFTLGILLKKRKNKFNKL